MLSTWTACQDVQCDTDDFTGLLLVCCLFLAHTHIPIAALFSHVCCQYPQVGLIEWVQNTEPLKSIYESELLRRQQQSHATSRRRGKSKVPASIDVMRMPASVHRQKWLTKIGRSNGADGCAFSVCFCFVLQLRSITVCLLPYFESMCLTILPTCHSALLACQSFLPCCITFERVCNSVKQFS